MKDRLILLLETSTSRCSAALAAGDRIISHRGTDVPKAHASRLCPFIEDILKEAAVPFSEIDAVAVSGGPGSYTGLRVGVSTAKGLCFGAGKPLISVGTLDVLAWQAVGSMNLTGESLVIPMVDARRMEVYTRTFSCTGEALSECRALVLDGDSFTEEFDRGGRIIFIGDGADKYRKFLEENQPDKAAGCVFVTDCPDAAAMLTPAMRKLEAGEFESSAYYEPFYLKDFVAGVSVRSVL